MHLLKSCLMNGAGFVLTIVLCWNKHAMSPSLEHCFSAMLYLLGAYNQS